MFGWETEEAVEDAREKIAKLINAESREIIFTSGATESNNLAIKGMAEFYKSRKNHLIALQTEHKCVLDSCRFLETRGFKITYLPVLKNGLVDLKVLEKAIIPDKTSIVCAMFVNNEIGVIQPVEKIGQICKKHNVHFHCDAAQAVGKIPVDVRALNVATLSISGHKTYGPKGTGALYVRKRPRVRLVPLFSGGGQERGLRSGTLSPALCVGLGKACELSHNNLDQDYQHVSRLASKLLTGIRSQLDKITLNGDEKERYPGCINLSFSCVEGESLMMGMNKIAVSSGSACTSESLEPSYVLRAIGVSDDMAHTSIR
ncbi:cysteine desulfurase, variant 2 [Bonamia ostreae]